eukprot:Rhum_TRINITY_DN15061_c1_g1::Rhum_TRINITY_DN15061_c1_g1_i1::g.133581::m.133581
MTRGGDGGEDGGEGREACPLRLAESAPDRDVYGTMPLLRKGGGGSGAVTSTTTSTSSPPASVHVTAASQPQAGDDGDGDDATVAPTVVTEVVEVRKEAAQRVGIDVSDVELADGRVLLRLRRVAAGSPAAAGGAERYVGWYLTAIDGADIVSLSGMRAATAGVEGPLALHFTDLSQCVEVVESDDDDGEDSMVHERHPHIEPDSADEACGDVEAAKEGVQEKKARRPLRGRRPNGGHSVAYRHSRYVVFLLPPVCTTMLVAVLSTLSFEGIGFYTGGGSQTVSSVLPIDDDPTHSHSSAARFGGALLNAVVITAIIVVLTFMFVCLYKCRCILVILAWLVLSSFIVLCGVGALWVERLCVRYQIPLDWLTFCVVVYNFTVVGLVCIYYRGHPSLTRCYHIATSAVLAWYMTRLPEWTTWCLLSTVALYDIFAVMCGPLKVLVEESARREEPIPALVYESRRYKLGLGDFIFYSLLVARAAVLGYAAWVPGFVGVVMGLCLTLFALGYLSRPLPALPCSIFIGIAMSFSGHYLLKPYLYHSFLQGVEV